MILEIIGTWIVCNWCHHFGPWRYCVYWYC